MGRVRLPIVLIYFCWRLNQREAKEGSLMTESGELFLAPGIWSCRPRRCPRALHGTPARGAQGADRHGVLCLSERESEGPRESGAMSGAPVEKAEKPTGNFAQQSRASCNDVWPEFPNTSKSHASTLDRFRFRCKCKNDLLFRVGWKGHQRDISFFGLPYSDACRTLLFRSCLICTSAACVDFWASSV